MFSLALLTLRKHSIGSTIGSYSISLFDDGIPVKIVALLFYWYSHQGVDARWHNVLSENFSIAKKNNNNF